MSVDSKEIELIIRANNQSKQTLDGVAKSIEELNQLIEAQGAASKKGQVGIDELKASLLTLQQAQDKLKSQANLVNQFERSGEAAEKAAIRVAKAQEAYSKYSDSKKDLGDNGEITEKRAAQLAKLEASVVRAEKAEAKRIETNQKLATQLREAGIAETELEGAENKLRQSAAELGLSIGRASTNIADYTKNLKIAQQVEKERAEQESFTKTATEAAKLVQAGEYVNWWADALKKQEAAQTAATNKDQLGKMATDAEQTARAFTTLAGSAGEAQPKLEGLFTTLKGISDPAAAARTTMSGLTEQSDKLAAAVDAINGPVKEYRTTLASLDAVQKSAMQQGASIDTYRNQMVAVRAARQEFVEARTQVTQLAAAMRQADVPTNEMAADMRKAQAALQQAANGLRGTIASAHEMRTALQQAGVDTRNLGQSEEQLVGIMRSAVSSVNSLTEAYKKNGAAVESAHGSLKLFGGERTTLSLLQRLKGEVLGLTAGYVGLQAAIGGAKEVIEATVERQSIENKFQIMNDGDAAKTQAMYDRIHAQSVRIGMDMKEMATSFSKFGLDAKESNMTMEQSEYAFNRVTEAMRVQHASGEAVNHFFTQLGQALNKGKIQMDDLRHASNWFPGFRALMAKGLADMNYDGIGKENPVGDMMAQMKKGSVDAGQAIMGFARQVELVYGKQVPDAMKSLQAEQGRFQTALFDFKQLVSEAGFGKAYTDFLARLNSMMDGPKAAEYAKTISDTFTKVLDVLQVMLDNIGHIGDALVTVFMVKGSLAIMEFVGNMPKLISSFQAATAQIGNMGRVMTGLVGALAAVDAAFIGWQIGSILYEKFSAVRMAGKSLVDSLLMVWAMIKGGAEVAWEGIKGVFVEGFAGLMNFLTTPLKEMLRAAKMIAEAAHQDDVVARINLAIVQATIHTEGWASRMKNINAILSDTKKEMEDIGTIWEQQMKDELNPPKEKAAVKKQDTPEVDPGTPPKMAQHPKDDKKRASLIESIKNELEALQAQVDKADKDNLEAQLQVFDERATALIAKIHKVGGAEAEAFSKRVAGIINDLKEQATDKYLDELDKEHNSALDKFNKVVDGNAKGYDNILKAKLNEVKKTYRDAMDELDKYESKLKGSELPGKPVDPDKLAEVTRMRTNLTASQPGAEKDAQGSAAKEAEAAEMKKLNDLLSLRKTMLEAITTEQKAGLITESQSLEKQKAVINEIQPKIDTMVNSIMEMAEKWGLTSEQLLQLKARLIVASTSADKLKTEMYSVSDAQKDIGGAANTTMKAFTDGLYKAATHAGTLSGAFKSAGLAFLKFAADFLQKIAEMILQQQILAALGGGSSSVAGGMSSWISGLAGGSAAASAGGSAAASSASTEAAMALFHSGGVVGQSGGMSRNASTSWFANAPKYHTGGVVGLSADEYPAILKKNEEVLTSDSPRNVLNGGSKSGGQQAQAPINLKVVNAIDSASVVQEGLSSTSGQKAMYNFLQANKSKVKNLLGS